MDDPRTNPTPDARSDAPPVRIATVAGVETDAQVEMLEGATGVHHPTTRSVASLAVPDPNTATSSNPWPAVAVLALIVAALIAAAVLLLT